VPADAVLLLVGYEADQTLCRLAGVETRGPGNVPVYDERTMQTSIPGIYLAGTVIGGTQEKYRVFLENCHIHVERILAAIQGRAAPAGQVEFAQPES
jgi:thioredoxin reductase (NADPH)